MSEFNDNEMDRCMHENAVTIDLLNARIAELQGPILTAMIDGDRTDSWIMRRLNDSHGRPGICWKHGAVDQTDCQIGPDFEDYWSCDRPDCSYHTLEGELQCD